MKYQDRLKFLFRIACLITFGFNIMASIVLISYYEVTYNVLVPEVVWSFFGTVGVLVLIVGALIAMETIYPELQYKKDIYEAIPPTGWLLIGGGTLCILVFIRVLDYVGVLP